MQSQKGAIAQQNQTGILDTASLGEGVKTRKHYSLAFKQECVRQIDAKETSVSALCRDHQVSSASVYNWLAAYSASFQKSVVVVTEFASESLRSKRLEAENKDLLAIIGKQQVEIRYWQTMIDSAEAHYSIDIKKNCVM